MRKSYIIGIFILFLIGSYFFFTEKGVNNQENIYQKKVNDYSGFTNDIDEEKKEISLHKNQDTMKKENNFYKISQEDKSLDDNFMENNIVPIDILEKIFLLRKGKENNESLQKKIATVEYELMNKLENESKQDTYNMFKKLLNSEETNIENKKYMFKKILHLEESNIEDKKYIIDFLEAIGTSESKILLVETYQNTEEEEIKEKISKLDTPEVYTLLALEANQNDDTDSYQLMMNKLEERTEEEVISGFMAFTKNDDSDSLDNITQLTEKWSNNNLSKQSAEIAEDYLSRGDVKPRERIVAISILSNMEDREKRDRILTKALEHEDDEDVVTFIQTTLDSEN